MTGRPPLYGEGWIRCRICGAVHVPPFPLLYVDPDGRLWDACAGACAIEATQQEET